MSKVFLNGEHASRGPWVGGLSGKFQTVVWDDISIAIGALSQGLDHRFSVD